jgi:hypothetical protein
MRIAFFILLSFTCQAQFKKHIPSLALTFIGGAADGTAEALKWHYDVVDMRFNLNDQYWNPQVSYVNKYAGGITANGPKFPGSTTYFVWTTDGYHMARMVRNASIVGSIVIHPHRKKKWYLYALDFVTQYAAYTAGFTATYNLSK